MGKDVPAAMDTTLIHHRLATEKAMRRLSFAAILVALTAACLTVALVVMKERPAPCQPQNHRVNFVPLELPADPAAQATAVERLLATVRHLVASEARVAGVTRAVIDRRSSNVTYLDTKANLLRKTGFLYATGGIAALSHNEGIEVPPGTEVHSTVRMVRPGRCGNGRAAVVEPSINVDNEQWHTSITTWRGPNGALSKFVASGVVSEVGRHRSDTLGHVEELFPGIHDVVHGHLGAPLHPVRSPLIETLRYATQLRMPSSNLVFVAHSWRPKAAGKGVVVPPGAAPAKQGTGGPVFGFLTVHPDSVVDNNVDAAVAIARGLMLRVAKEHHLLPQQCHGPMGLCDNPVTTFLDRGSW